MLKKLLGTKYATTEIKLCSDTTDHVKNPARFIGIGE